ncbi:MAG: nitroreductase family protein [Anaerolineae bacterium]
MTYLNLSPDELLTTTRSVRKRLDFDRPVALDLIYECLEIALQAPTGSNSQNWHFVVVTDSEKKLALAEIYRRAWASYRNSPRSVYFINQETGESRTTQQRVASSAEYLQENMHRVPVMLIPCLAGRMDPASCTSATAAARYGSVLPATWSFMLAARARGLGTSLTTLHLMFEEEAARVLNIPYAEVTQVCLVPIAYAIGTEFSPAVRKDTESVLHVNKW